MSGGPTGCQPSESFLKIGPTANASAGSVKPIAISAPAPWAVPVMNRRRVTVSPSKAPGMPRSAVYLDLLGLRVGANDDPRDGRARRIPSSRAAALIQRQQGIAAPHTVLAEQELGPQVGFLGPPADRARPRAPERLAAREIGRA